MYIHWISSTFSVAANRNLHSQIHRQDNSSSRRELLCYLTNICRACKPTLCHLPGYHSVDLTRRWCSKFVNTVDWGLALVYLFRKGFVPQAIGTQICTRLSGLGTVHISTPASGLVRRLFLCHRRACGGMCFSAILELSTEAIFPPASGLVRNLFPHKPLV